MTVGLVKVTRVSGHKVSSDYPTGLYRLLTTAPLHVCLKEKVRKGYRACSERSLASDPEPNPNAHRQRQSLPPTSLTHTTHLFPPPMIPFRMIQMILPIQPLALPRDRAQP